VPGHLSWPPVVDLPEPKSVNGTVKTPIEGASLVLTFQSSADGRKYVALSRMQRNADRHFRPSFLGGRFVNAARR
jgi:hypothetical protein